MSANPSLEAPRPHRRGARIAGIVTLAMFGVFIAGYVPRKLARTRLVDETKLAAAVLPRVRVSTATAHDSSSSLTLPGDMVANQRTTIYARATGFIRSYEVDIGRRVKAGDLLAVVDTPELGDQLSNARAALDQKEAALAQSLANRDYAHITAAREDKLLEATVASKQENDQAHAQALVSDANVTAARADVVAARATVKQLEQLVAFGRVVAPFDGTITQRLIEVGTLVSTGTASPTALFELEATDPIRVFIRVPQTYAPSVNDGQKAQVSVRQYPGRHFDGVVTRTAGALDPTSRTLNTEVDVPNPKGELLAGMYADVMLGVRLSHPVVRVPSSAVLNDARGVRVAVVDDAGYVHLVAVRPGPDDGNIVDLVDGLKGGERVIISPGGDVVDGMQVTPVQSTPSPSAR